MFNWLDFLSFAEGLPTHYTSEASRRTALSRMYYSVFCISRGKCKVVSKKTSVHQEVIAKLKNNDDPDLIMAGSLLETLREQRNLADYQADAHIDERLVGRSLLKAKQIVRILQEYEGYIE